MKEAYKKCMKEKNTIKIKSYESPCGVLLLGSFGGKLCLCDWQVEKHCDRVNQRLKRVLCAEFEIQYVRNNRRINRATQRVFCRTTQRI